MFLWWQQFCVVYRMPSKSSRGFRDEHYQMLSWSRWSWCSGQGNIPLNTLLYDVPKSKNLLYAASTFPKPCLFLSQLSIRGTINPLEEDSAKDLAGDGQNVMPRQMSQLLRSPFFGILDIRPLLQSLGMVSIPDLSKEISKHQGGCGDICLQLFCL